MSIQVLRHPKSGKRNRTCPHSRSRLRYLVVLSLTALGLINPAAAQLSEYEVDQLTFLKEEEKLARDVYTTLGAQWNLRVFENIARSEQVHMDQVDTLLTTYGLPDPAREEVGTFQNPVLQHLYDRLTVEGSHSLQTALGVGEFIEVIDIKDLDDLLTATRSSAIQDVAARLRAGSVNHLTAFRRQLAMLPPAIPEADPTTELVNLSARGLLGQGEQSLIGGFVVEGTESLQVLISVRGPSLTAYGVIDPAQDPALVLYHGDTVIGANDDWSTSPSGLSIESPQDFNYISSEAAMLVDLEPGAYTFVAENLGSGSIGLVEIFRWSEASTQARLANISVRGQSGLDEERLIAGFVVDGNGSIPVTVRALGPTLSTYGVTEVMQEPMIQIYRQDHPVGTVEDWIHADVLGVVPSDHWPESILEPLEWMNQAAGTVTVHAISPTAEPGVVLLDITVLEP